MPHVPELCRGAPATSCELPACRAIGMIPVWASLSSDSPTPTRAQVLHDPLTCTPCGHTFCARCLRTEVGGGGEYKLAVCPECDGPAGKVVSVGMLGTLTAKFEYQKQTLAELKAGALAASAASKLVGLVQTAKLQAK